LKTRGIDASPLKKALKARSDYKSLEQIKTIDFSEGRRSFANVNKDRNLSLMEKLVAKQVDNKSPNLLKFLEKNRSKNRLEL
jgi:hypothetical protein